MFVSRSKEFCTSKETVSKSKECGPDAEIVSKVSSNKLVLKSNEFSSDKDIISKSRSNKKLVSKSNELASKITKAVYESKVMVAKSNEIDPELLDLVRSEIIIKQEEDEHCSNNSSTNTAIANAGEDETKVEKSLKFDQDGNTPKISSEAHLKVTSTLPDVDNNVVLFQPRDLDCSQLKPITEYKSCLRTNTVAFDIDSDDSMVQSEIKIHQPRKFSFCTKFFKIFTKNKVKEKLKECEPVCTKVTLKYGYIQIQNKFK